VAEGALGGIVGARNKPPGAAAEEFAEAGRGQALDLERRRGPGESGTEVGDGDQRDELTAVGEELGAGREGGDAGVGDGLLVEAHDDLGDDGRKRHDAWAGRR
jgi:hypothetical protein